MSATKLRTLVRCRTRTNHSRRSSVSLVSCSFRTSRPHSRRWRECCGREGSVVCNLWDGFEANRVAGIAHETIARHFDANPPSFLEVPFGSCAPEPTRKLFESAGFESPTVHTVEATVECPSALEVARGFVEGNPGVLEIQACRCGTRSHHPRAGGRTGARFRTSAAADSIARVRPPRSRFVLRAPAAAGSAPSQGFTFERAPRSARAARAIYSPEMQLKPA